jgi:hypothetical protein
MCDSTADARSYADAADEQMAEMHAAYFEPSLNRMNSSSSEIGIHFRLALVGKSEIY